MSKKSQATPAGFSQLLNEVKDRLQEAQTRAVLAANAELVMLYWDIGRIIDDRQRQEGWGAAVIPRLSRELRNELPEVQGFSERNIKRMLYFYRAYPEPCAIVQQDVAQLPQTPLFPATVAKSKGAGESAAACGTIGAWPKSAAACGTIAQFAPLVASVVPSHCTVGKGQGCAA